MRFKITNTCLTIFGKMGEIYAVQPATDGYDQGSFIVKAQ